MGDRLTNTPDNAAGAQMSGSDASKSTRRASGMSARERSTFGKLTIAGSILTLALVPVLLSNCGRTQVGPGADGGTGTGTGTPTPGPGEGVTPVPVNPPDVCRVASDHQDSCEVNGVSYDVPMIADTRAEVHSGKVILYATSDIYGAELNGKAIGQYVPEVKEDGTKTGAIGFVPEVVTKLMDGKPGSTIVLAADLSQAKGSVDISIDPNSPEVTGAGLITISANGSDLTIRNIRPGTTGFTALNSIWPPSEGLMTDWELVHNDSMTPGHASDYIEVYVPDGQVRHAHHTYSFGDTVGTSKGQDVHITYGLKSGDGADLHNQILNVNGVPVFLMGTPNVPAA